MTRKKMTISRKLRSKKRSGDPSTTISYLFQSSSFSWSSLSNLTSFITSLLLSSFSQRCRAWLQSWDFWSRETPSFYSWFYYRRSCCTRIPPRSTCSSRLSRSPRSHWGHRIKILSICLISTKKTTTFTPLPTTQSLTLLSTLMFVKKVMCSNSMTIIRTNAG